MNPEVDADTEIVVRSLKYDGSLNREWKCRLVRSNETVIECVGTFETDVRHNELGSIAAGTTSYEYFWFDRWYSIFCFFEPDGPFRNYYLNINKPPTFDGEVLSYIDLDIDYVIWPGGSSSTLDEAEHRVNAVKYSYSADVLQNIEKARTELECLIPTLPLLPVNLYGLP